MTTAVKELFEPVWTSVCPLYELQEYVGVCAKVGSEQVAVFLVDGEVYAIGNNDPFSGANVLSRGIVGDLDGELVVASPIYKQHFSLRTGVCLEDDSVQIPTYSVLLDGDTVMLEVPVESRSEAVA